MEFDFLGNIYCQFFTLSFKGLGSVRFSFNEINYFIQKGCIQLICDSKDKFLFQKMLLFWTFCPEKKMYHGFKNIKQDSCFQHYNNNKKKKNCLFDWFLKDHVTLKTGVIAAENSLLCHRNKLHFKMNLK